MIIILEYSQNICLFSDSIVLAEGPVYDGGAPQAPSPPPAGNFLTQTVYGFLDFTTTIGNTVMVFSPQSAPPPGQIFIYFYLLFYSSADH